MLETYLIQGETLITRGEAFHPHIKYASNLIYRVSNGHLNSEKHSNHTKGVRRLRVRNNKGEGGPRRSLYLNHISQYYNRNIIGRGVF